MTANQSTPTNFTRWIEARTREIDPDKRPLARCETCRLAARCDMRTDGGWCSRWKEDCKREH